MRERILNTSYELIYRFGLRGLTMDDLASELGMSKKTLYKYFASKNQLLSEIVDRIVEAEKRLFLEEVEKKTHWMDKLEVALNVYISGDIPYRLVDELYRYFPKEKEKIEELSEFRRAIILPVIEQGRKCGEIRADLNPAIIISVIHTMFMTPADQKILETHDITVKQLLEQLKRLFFYGILEPENRLKLERGEREV